MVDYSAMYFVQMRVIIRMERREKREKRRPRKQKMRVLLIE